MSYYIKEEHLEFFDIYEFITEGEENPDICEVGDALEGETCLMCETSAEELLELISPENDCNGKANTCEECKSCKFIKMCIEDEEIK